MFMVSSQFMVSNKYMHNHICKCLLCNNTPGNHSYSNHHTITNSSNNNHRHSKPFSIVFK